MRSQLSIMYRTEPIAAPVPLVNSQCQRVLQKNRSDTITESAVPMGSKFPTLWGRWGEKRGIFLCLHAFTWWQWDEKGLHQHHCSVQALCFTSIGWCREDHLIQTKTERFNSLASRKCRTTVTSHYNQTHQPPQHKKSAKGRVIIKSFDFWLWAD